MELNFEYLKEHATERAHKPPPTLELDHLDTLWLQVTGTLCNLACLHCFISCGPKNDSHDYMSVEAVRRAVETAAAQGTKDYYFTGGEPFLHDDIQEMIELTLEHGPLTVLTNGILIDEEMADWLAQTFRNSRYSFDLRVSLDGTTKSENDALRGRGTFEKIIASIERLYAAGLNPVITVTTCHAGSGGEEGRRKFYEFVRSRGVEQPRLKFLAPFKIGREERRGGGYEEWERLVEGDLLPDEAEQLQCSSCRMVTSKGVYPCPILIEYDDALMGQELEDGLQAIELRHQACYTCHVEGVTCST
ncbi:radical SAM protein [Persicimonas caeni]|jgi:sulfatase maturation enzyme AslB (radical SAM superfamily)|uniref:Radical SAM protein n=1 Tax=Persicimonas caeni TaxID=2292766 RepID=A0A4Y6PRM6_PERCE|nr:radical SAM protein [Persicimonas caeni]QDG50883.1 radical SAM protein [Persicimonas caeni]QED32104.1 radical SAM protein [Persicimonas caeni]